MRLVQFAAIGSLILVLAGCGSPDPASNEIARESAESNAVIQAAEHHPALSNHSASATGKPLPPLPGVNVPASETENTPEPKHHHPER